MYEEEYKEDLDIVELYEYKSRERLLKEFLKLLNAKFPDKTLFDLTLNFSEKEQEKEVKMKKDITSKIDEISSNTAELNSKFNTLISLSKEMVFILEKILETLSKGGFNETFGKEKKYIVRIRNHVGKKTQEELPKFNSLEEKIKYIHSKIKEIGPVSKRSAIEE